MSLQYPNSRGDVPPSWVGGQRSCSSSFSALETRDERGWLLLGEVPTPASQESFGRCPRPSEGGTGTWWRDDQPLCFPPAGDALRRLHNQSPGGPHGHVWGVSQQLRQLLAGEGPLLRVVQRELPVGLPDPVGGCSSTTGPKPLVLPLPGQGFEPILPSQGGTSPPCPGVCSVQSAGLGGGRCFPLPVAGI